MTPELTALALAALLQVLQFTLYSVTANRQVGTRTALSPRDTPVVLKGRTGRVQRAMNNHFEGLILFTIAVVVVTLSGQATLFTAICAWVYLIARIFYVPAYVMGLNPWRSVIWFVGFTATVLILLASLI